MPDNCIAVALGLPQLRIAEAIVGDWVVQLVGSLPPNEIVVCKSSA